MRHLITTLGAIAAAMMFLVMFVPRIIACALSSVALAPEPRIRDPGLFASLKSFLGDISRAVFDVFGATPYETLTTVAAMRSGPEHLDPRPTSARDPTHSTVVGSFAKEIVDGVMHGLAGGCKTISGRVAKNP